MEPTTIKLPLGGKEIDITIKRSVNWGEFQGMMKKVTASGSIDLEILSNELLILTTFSKQFDFKDKEQLRKIDFLEMADIVGQVIEIFPLMQCLDKLKIGKGGNLDKLMGVPQQS